jgi:trehalose 6-phosphate synthase/phosphatase
MSINHFLLNKFQEAKHILILLDYDGTVVEYAATPNRALPTHRLLNVLLKLCSNPRVQLIIVTGRAYQNIDKLIGSLPVDIIAEHGAMIKIKGHWEKRINDDGSWKNKILPFFNMITSSCPNSFVEEKHYSIAWHYRNADKEAGYHHSMELIRILEHIAPSYNLEIFTGHCIVEIMSKETNKGIVTESILTGAPYDYILCAGDDRTDEYMFRSLENVKNADTIKVGAGETLAKYRLNNVEQTISFLEKLVADEKIKD